MLIKTADELRGIVQRIALALGTPADSAAAVANHLVGAHLAGHDSHGIQNLPRYVAEVRAGGINPEARPCVVSEQAASALVRGNWGWGFVTANLATRVAIGMARQHKIALVSAVEVNHMGRVGDYVEQAAAEGIILIMVASGMAEHRPAAATYGGREAVLATNPIAMGFPVMDGPPVVLDYATTMVAAGKVAAARAKGDDLPSGCLIDRRGKPSTSPHDWYNGGVLLPFGAHKGSAMMVAVEILGRILSGADAYAATAPSGTDYPHKGVSAIAIDSGVFGSASHFAASTATLVRRIEAAMPATGFAEVLAPGGPEHRARASRLKEGIPIPESTWREVAATVESLGLTL
jgi:uncharacterized oxidoreductase